MLQIQSFTFNPFEENTYLLWDDASGDCWIVDPGCYSRLEQQQLETFVRRHGLRPVRLLNTHCHIDHVLGNAFVSELYGLELSAHSGETPVLEAAERVSQMYGLPGYRPSPASVGFYAPEHQVVVCGDVLFRGSIGRTDLPGGSMPILLHSIRTQLLPLPDEVQVLSGHGGPTTIGRERKYNPFLQ